MAEVIIMPKLGFNMDEGQLVKWHKQVGDPVAKGEVLFEINTDKTTMPVEATTDGIMLKIMLQEDEYADVFTPIAVVGAEGEDADAAIAAAGGAEEAPAAVVEEVEEEVVVADPQSIVSSKDVKITPRAKRYMSENNLSVEDVQEVTGTGFQGGITEKDLKATPLAKKVAAKKNVDLSTVDGTGINGKITKSDVLKAAEGQAAPAAVASTDDKKVLSEAPYKGVRKIIGDRLSESKFTAPHLYFTDSIDTSNLTKFRKELNETQDTKIAVSDLLILAASKALTKFPGINSSLVGDKIITYKSTNVGMAVAGNNGLVVPVVKNAQEKTLTAIAQETRDLVGRAKEGKLTADEYTGGTFSISNLGMFGIENFTAIINPPEAAILSVSSVKKTPVVVEEDGEDKIVIRPMMKVQLSVDHRIIDGLLAAQFVGYMKELLENPIKILI